MRFTRSHGQSQAAADQAQCRSCCRRVEPSSGYRSRGQYTSTFPVTNDLCASSSVCNVRANRREVWRAFPQCSLAGSRMLMLIILPGEKRKRHQSDGVVSARQAASAGTTDARLPLLRLQQLKLHAAVNPASLR